MILFTDRAGYIRCFRTKTNEPGADNIGTLRKPDENSEWLWDVSGVSCFRTWVGYETLDGSEKRQIIGLLDKLNGIGYRNPDNMRMRWEEIIGLKSATFRSVL